MSNYGTDRNMNFDNEIAKCKTTEELDRLKDTKKVDLYTFILHLYIQQFYSIDLRSSFMSREEYVDIFYFLLNYLEFLLSWLCVCVCDLRWPVNRNEGQDRRKSRTMDEMNFMNFVSKNIDEIISLYMSERTTNQNEVISEDILQALNFLLEGSIDNMKTVLPLSLLLKQQSVQSQFVRNTDSL